MTDIELTICVRCRHHVHTHPGGPAGPPPGTWFYQMCGAEALRIQDHFDPVLGITPEPRMPYCRDVNNGECHYFEAAS